MVARTQEQPASEVSFSGGHQVEVVAAEGERLSEVPPKIIRQPGLRRGRDGRPAEVDSSGAVKRLLVRRTKHRQVEHVAVPVRLRLLHLHPILVSGRRVVVVVAGQASAHRNRVGKADPVFALVWVSEWASGLAEQRDELRIETQDASIDRNPHQRRAEALSRGSAVVGPLRIEPIEIFVEDQLPSAGDEDRLNIRGGEALGPRVEHPLDQRRQKGLVEAHLGRRGGAPSVVRLAGPAPRVRPRHARAGLEANRLTRAAASEVERRADVGDKQREDGAVRKLSQQRRLAFAPRAQYHLVSTLLDSNGAPPDAQISLRIANEAAQRAVRLAANEEVEADPILLGSDDASKSAVAVRGERDRRRVAVALEPGGRLDPVPSQAPALDLPAEFPSYAGKLEVDPLAVGGRPRLERTDSRQPAVAVPRDEQVARDFRSEHPLGTPQPDQLGGIGRQAGVRRWRSV